VFSVSRMYAHALQVRTYDVDASEYKGFAQYSHGASQTCPHHELAMEDGVSAVTLSPAGSRAWASLKISTRLFITPFRAFSFFPR